jgi:chorismate dehydratase
MSESIMAIAPRQTDLQSVRSVPLRIGAVAYLNSKPLIEGLSQTDREFRLILDYPSRLADDLAAGELDVALIPSVECLVNPEYTVISDACVATSGPVLSVKLYSRVPPGEIRTLALDEGSRTSAALVRTYLVHKYGIEPETRSFPIDSETLDSSSDAVLMIGDRAMFEPAGEFHTVWDLGEEWLKWTGLPFVFAVWAGRESPALDPLERKLSAARDRGLKQLKKIAAREAAALGISQELATNYLTKNLHFTLGSAERNGFRLFQELATDAGIIPGGTEVVFRH